MSKKIIEKLDELEKYSNPNIVRKKLKKLYGNKMELYISNRKDKKYMIYHPETNKKIHFGQMGYKDYTLNDVDREDRRKRFLQRNHKWADAEHFTPAHLSWYILWN